MVIESNKPHTYADIRLLSGRQGGGKSETLTALPVGDYHDKLVGIRSPNGQLIKAISVSKSVNPADYSLLKKMGIYPNKLKYVRVYSPDGKQSKLIQIPKGYIVESPIKIFANYTLYGVRFTKINLQDVIKYMDTDLFNDAWILSDESAMTNSRNSMTQAGKLMAQFGATIRKRRARFCIAVQFSKMTDWYYRAFATTTIICSYDEETKCITLEITKKGEQPFMVDYYAPLYYKYFKTGEIIAQPQHVIDRALNKFGDGSLAQQVAALKKQLEQREKELADAEEANLTLRQALVVPQGS